MVFGELSKWGARGDVEGVGVGGLDAGLDFEIGGSANHSRVVTGEFGVGEVDGGIWIRHRFG